MTEAIPPSLERDRKTRELALGRPMTDEEWLAALRQEAEEAKALAQAIEQAGFETITVHPHLRKALDAGARLILAERHLKKTP
jgi:hypothetical protein